MSVFRSNQDCDALLVNVAVVCSYHPFPVATIQPSESAMSLSSRWLCPHILFTACTLFLLPDRGLTFVPVIQQSSTSMFRRHNGGKALLPIIKASDNNNGRAWEKYFRLMGTSPSDDLTTQIAKSQSPTSAMSEEDFGKTAAITQNQRSFSLSALEHPSLELGRFLVLLASCIYGTNFSIVKLLDDTMPLSISATLRFGLAALVVSSVVLRKESDDVDPVVNKERNRAFWGGFEIGLWYCIGYIAQGTMRKSIRIIQHKNLFFYEVSCVDFFFIFS